MACHRNRGVRAMVLRRVVAVLLVLLCLPLTGFSVDRKWEAGILVSLERKDDPGNVAQPPRSYTESDGNPERDGSPTDAPAGRSSPRSSWMYYTISSGTKLYLVRIPASVPSVNKPKADVGARVEYAIDGTEFYLRNPDGSEVRAELLKTTAKVPQSPPPPPSGKHEHP